MAYEYNEGNSTTAPVESPVVEMPVTVFSPLETPPLVNATNVNNIDTAENNFISDNYANGILSENSEYQTTNSSGGLVFVDSVANTTTILNPDTAEISVYNNNTEMLTVYTTDPKTSGYSLHIDNSDGVAYSQEGTIYNDSGASFPVSSGTLQQFYGVNGVNRRALMDDYRNSSYTSVPSMTLPSLGNSLSNVSDARPVVQVNSNSEIVNGESPSDFKYYFDQVGYIGPYDIDNYDTYEEFYELDKKYDVFGTISDNFDKSIEQLLDVNGEIGSAWADIDTDYKKILSEFDDLFNVGGLDISAALSPLKECYSSAKGDIDAFLSEVSAEYSSVSAKKRAILAARAAAAAAAKKRAAACTTEA